MLAEIILYIIILIYGIVIGSFLNVCIYRLPKHEDIVVSRSHCMTCNHKLQWYDLVPLASYITLKGRCRYCKTKISLQYPLIEAFNGIGYVAIFLVCGFNLPSILYCLTFSALIVLSVIDYRSYEIPFSINIVIFVIGAINALYDIDNWLQYVIGFFAVSVFLLLLYIITRGRGIGGGDIKLMAAAGLLLGWKKIVLALVIGCVLGSIIHLTLMRIKNKDRVLAFGPYLAAGIMISIMYGEIIIDWYVNSFLY